MPLALQRASLLLVKQVARLEQPGSHLNYPAVPAGLRASGKLVIVMLFTRVLCFLFFTSASSSLAAKPPDLSGTWVTEKGLYYSLTPTDGKGIPVQPWAYEIASRSLTDARDGKIPANNNRECLPIGRGREMQSVWPFMILQTETQITFLMEENSRTYFVYLNQSHPENLQPSWKGHSVGHWEGDTLVVDTIGMNDKTPLVANSRTQIPHTESLHLIERFRLIDDGKRLENRATIDDTKTFTRPFDVITRYTRLEPTDRLLEHVCAQNYVDYNEKSDEPK